MADFKLTVGDNEYTFDPKMLTSANLSKVKEWYGKELGRYNNFIEAFFEGDPDAARSAVWIARKAAGEPNPPEPRQMEDFSLAEWIKPGEIAEDETEVNPTDPPPTPASTETQTNSEDDTSGKSPTSSSGRPKK